MLTKPFNKYRMTIGRTAYLLFGSLLCILISYCVNSAEKVGINVFTLAKVTNIKGIEVKPIDTEQQTFSLVAEQLTGFEFHYKESSYQHALNYMKEYPNTCIRDLVKNPERDKLFIFSQPQTLVLGARIYLSPRASSKKSKKTDEINEIELDQFIKTHPDYLLAIQYERSYGESLDKQIKLIPDRNKYLVKGSSSESVLVMMVYNNKVDAIIEYPDMIYNASEILSEQLLSSYGIKQSERFQFGRIACSRTEEGQHLINEFNKALSNVYSYPSYLKAHTQWIDESSHDAFQQLFQQLFLNKRD